MKYLYHIGLIRKIYIIVIPGLIGNPCLAGRQVYNKIVNYKYGSPDLRPRMTIYSNFTYVKLGLLILVCIISLNIYLGNIPVFAQTEIPSPIPTKNASPTIDQAIQKKIQELKDRLATRVAELKETSRKSFYGVVKEVNDTSMILVYNSIESPISISQTAKLFKLDTKGNPITITKDSLSIGEDVVAFGSLDVDQKTMVVDSLILQDVPIIDKGIVSDSNTKKGTFTLTGESGPLTLDYEITTRCFLYEKESKKTCGLSKIKPGDYVFVRYKPNASDNTGIATRILVIPKTTLLDYAITIVTPTPTAPLTPAVSTTSPSSSLTP